MELAFFTTNPVLCFLRGGLYEADESRTLVNYEPSPEQNLEMVKTKLNIQGK